MVVLDRNKSKIEHVDFTDIYNYLRSGDLLVLNDSYVLANTLLFRMGMQSLQVIVYGQEPDGSSVVDIRPATMLEPQMTLISVDDERLIANLLELKADGFWRVKFEPQECLLPALVQYGQRYGQPFPSSGDTVSRHFDNCTCHVSFGLCKHTGVAADTIRGASFFGSLAEAYCRSCNYNNVHDESLRVVLDNSQPLME